VVQRARGGATGFDQGFGGSVGAVGRARCARCARCGEEEES